MLPNLWRTKKNENAGEWWGDVMDDTERRLNYEQSRRSGHGGKGRWRVKPDEKREERIYVEWEKEIMRQERAAHMWNHYSEGLFYRDCSAGCDFLQNFVDLKKSCAAGFTCQVPNENKNCLWQIIGVTRQLAGNFIRKCNIIHGLGDVTDANQDK